MSHGESEYLRKQREAAEKKQIAADAEKQAGEDKSYRDQIIGSFQRAYEYINARDKHGDARERRDWRVERLRFRRERKKFRVDVAAVIIASAAGLFLIGQDILLGISIKDARKAANDQIKAMSDQRDMDEANFVLDERPILSLYPQAVPLNAVYGAHYNPKNGEIYWNIGIRNFGKGTAFHILSYEYLSVLGGHFIGTSNGAPRHGADVVPTDAYWLSVSDGRVWSKKDAMAAINNPNYGIIAEILLRYSDTIGNVYESPLCVATNGPTVIRNCRYEQFKNIPVENPPPPTPKKIQ